MADDKTQHFGNGSSFEERVLAQLAAIDSRLNTMEHRFDERLSALEAQAEERSRETRPIWEKALAEIMAGNERLSGVEKEIRQLGRKIDLFAEDLTRARIDVRDLDARVGSLEQKST